MRIGGKSKAAALFAGMMVSAIVFGTLSTVGDEGDTLVGVDPVSNTVSPGETFTVNVSCVPGQAIKSFEFGLSFNASLLQANSVSEGNIFDGFDTFFNDGTINNTAGTIVDIYGLIVGAGSVSDAGTFVTISFTVLLTTGVSSLGLSLVGVTNETEYVPVVVSNGTVSSEVYTLTVNTVGSGSVAKNPDQATYDFNDVVTLTASADDGWSFVSWSGDLSGSQNPKTITMTGNMVVTATFADSAAPEIDNVVATTSDQLDTDPLFGWVNMTVDVTDNVAVDDVYLNITDPNGASINVSMISTDGDTFYYQSNTAFSSYGNYSYFVWANDTSGNGNSSSGFAFSMSPNWDINNDGGCNVFDLVLISNHYGEVGTVGWIREDVDNNGEIEVLDLVLTSNEYGASWWV